MLGLPEGRRPPVPSVEFPEGPGDRSRLQLGALVLTYGNPSAPIKTILVSCPSAQ